MRIREEQQLNPVAEDVAALTAIVRPILTGAIICLLTGLAIFSYPSQGQADAYGPMEERPFPQRPMISFFGHNPAQGPAHLAGGQMAHVFDDDVARHKGVGIREITHTARFNADIGTLQEFRSFVLAMGYDNETARNERQQNRGDARYVMKEPTDDIPGEPSLALVVIGRLGVLVIAGALGYLFFKALDARP